MKKIQVWLPLLFAIVMIVGMRIGFKLRENVPVSQGFFQSGKRSSLQEVMDLVRSRYVDPVNTDTLTEDAVQAMLTHLDPHSVFIPAIHLSEVNEDLQGNFEGIGVEFHIIRDTVHVVTILPDGPSDKAGLKVGDKFLKVGDSVVTGAAINAERIKKLLRGEGGSQVKVILLREDQQRPFSIMRGTIPLYSIDAAYMIDGETGFIHLNKFSGTSYEEFMQAMERLQKQGMKKLIFDLRDNGGGILGEAVDISDEFLDDNKMIVYTKGDKQDKYEYRCKRPGSFEKGRLVILVDEGSASASEVVAGALQDWDRAIIIGRRTFGKGLVQEQYQLSNGAALRLTVARYYTPTGRSIQKPYGNGRDAYYDEVLERFHSGEVVHPDTIKIARGDSFKTKGGRMVYGGGGIMPDIFVPYDTAGFITDVTVVFRNNTFGKFIYSYYISNRPYFDQFKNPADFANRFNQSEVALRSLADYAAKDSIELNIASMPLRDQQELQRRIKTWMARQIWRMDGYYQVNNIADKTVQRALESVKK
ncbi:MAG: S41 family peptidase [Chitinophagaceae bacterium]|nr:S41 family peptidase [Chitinophagaceae bacterium]